MDEDDEPVDIEGDGDGDSRDMNEYEWNGHRRMAKSSHSNHPCKIISVTPTVSIQLLLISLVIFILRMCGY
jgi:hypothetical protein